MLAQYTDGKVPAVPDSDQLASHALVGIVSDIEAGLGRRMEALDFSGALEDIWRLVGRANKYVEESKPWELRKDETRAGELSTVLYNLVQVGPGPDVRRSTPTCPTRVSGWRNSWGWSRRRRWRRVGQRCPTASGGAG